MKINPWIKTTVIATIGGGVSAAVAAAMDPSKWRFPQDLGSGKLWPFFLEGAGLMFVGSLLRSPLGQKTMAAFKDSQQQLKDNQQIITETKVELKETIKPK